MPGTAWRVMLPEVPGTAPVEVEGVPGAVWSVTLPGEPGVTPPEVTGVPGKVLGPGLGVAKGGSFPGCATLGGSGRSLRTSSVHGAEGSVPSIAPVQWRATRSASLVLWGHTEPHPAIMIKAVQIRTPDEISLWCAMGGFSPTAPFESVTQRTYRAG